MKSINSSQKASDLIRNNIDKNVEELWGIALSSSKTLIKFERIFRGTSDACLFHPRDIFRFAIVNYATSIIIVHNHPFGDSQPSKEDIAATVRLIKICSLLDIELTDHIIIGPINYFSFRDNRLLRSCTSRVNT